MATIDVSIRTAAPADRSHGLPWRVAAVLGGFVVALAAALGAAQASRTDTDAAEVAMPLAAARYLTALQPEARQRLGDQVRAEQRAGATAPGNAAFVQRRLELYEAELQQLRGTTAERTPS